MKPVLALLVLAAALPAAERQFTYSHESNVLAPKEKELEIIATQKQGREYYYRASEQRLELEVGVAPGLQAAFYLNFSAEQTDKDGDGTVEKKDTIKGWAGELKYQLTDAAADAIGSALYGEVYVGAHELKGEAKVILDKRVGNWLVATNFVAEAAQAQEPGANLEWEGKITGGASYRIGGGVSAGIEGVFTKEWVNEDDDGYELEKAVLQIGPVVHYANEALWATFTLLPQVRSFAEQTSGSLDLDHSQRIEGRLIVGTHF